MKTFMLGEIPLGKEQPPIFLPDIDMFFNGDLSVAERTIKVLLDSKVKVVKGAVIHRADIALDDETTESYYSPSAGMITENYRKLMERKTISLDEHEVVFAHCKKAGAELVLSVYDIDGAAFAKDVGACAIKIPSTNITHEPLISFLGKLALPVIIDTGKSTFEEISRAMQWAQDSGVAHIAIEHSPEAPPSSLDNHNLLMIQALEKMFNCPVGLSDHHCGDEMMGAAIALGASFIEKGVCLDTEANDQDVYHALNVYDVKESWQKCLNIYQALGCSSRYLRRDRVKPSARMGMVARDDLNIDQVISLENVDFAFPAKGISTEYWGLVKGWKLKSTKLKGEVIDWNDVEV